jgi:hypothetical protein
MIYNGSNGTVCFYFKGLLISSYPLTKKKTLHAYLNQGTELIRASKGIPIMTQVKTYKLFCNSIYRRKKEGLPIRRSDHIYFLNCITALLRLRMLENDETNGYMCFPKKKLL